MANPSPGTALPPNFNPVGLEVPSIGTRSIASGAVTGTFVTLAVGARLYTKIWITESVGWDDYFSVMALAFALARVVGQCVLAVFYGGRIPASISLPDLIISVTHASSHEVAIEVLYLWAVLFAKISILALYIRVFGQVDRTFRRVCHVVAAIVVTYCVTCTPLYVFSCLPTGARTLEQFVAGQCIPTVPLNLAIGALNIATDTVLIALPIPPLLKLQMTSRRKLELLGIFGTGTIAWAASVGREWLFVQNLDSTDGINTEIYDILWLTTEMNVGIIAGCLPVLQPLFQRVGSYFSRAYSSARDSISRLKTPRRDPPIRSISEQPYSDSQRVLSRMSEDKSNASLRQEPCYPMQSLENGGERGDHVLLTP